MKQRYIIIIFIFILTITKSYCQKDFFNDMGNNMSWRDSIECFIVVKQLQNSDYAFITQSDKIVYGKVWNTYKKISKQYDIVSINMSNKTATKYKIEKIIKNQQKQFEDSDTNFKRFVIKKTKIDFTMAVDFFQYVDSLSFYKLNNDSLLNKCGVDSLGTRSCLDFTDISPEVIYIKNKFNYRSVCAYWPEQYLRYFPKNDRERMIFIECRNRFKNLIKQ